MKPARKYVKRHHLAETIRGDGHPAWRDEAKFLPCEDPRCGGCQLAAEYRRRGNAGAGCADHDVADQAVRS